MAISGLIITFSPDSPDVDQTLETLRHHPLIQIGEGSDLRFPVVVETSDATQANSLWEWLNALPGVAFIDLAYLHFEETGGRVSAEQEHDSETKHDIKAT